MPWVPLSVSIATWDPCRPCSWQEARALQVFLSPSTSSDTFGAFQYLVHLLHPLAYPHSYSLCGNLVIVLKNNCRMWVSYICCGRYLYIYGGSGEGNFAYLMHCISCPFGVPIAGQGSQSQPPTQVMWCGNNILNKVLETTMVNLSLY